MKSIINEIVVNNVKKLIEFYCKYFEFKVLATEENNGIITWAEIEKDSLSIMFHDYSLICKEYSNYPEKHPASNIIMFKYESKEEAKKIYDLLKGNNIEMFSDWTETDYGTVEFIINDLEENKILISA